jgi:hypothetical protein
MERLGELEDVFGVEFQVSVSMTRGVTVTGVILTVPHDMSVRLVVRMVKMALEEHGLSAETGKPYQIPDLR